MQIKHSLWLWLVPISIGIIVLLYLLFFAALSIFCLEPQAENEVKIKTAVQKHKTFLIDFIAKPPFIKFKYHFILSISLGVCIFP